MIPAALFLLFTIVTADPIFMSERGRKFSRELLWEHRGNMVNGTESAAFIVDTGDGNLVCLVWPATHQHHKESFYGGIPARTIAIIHTHPPNMPIPSPEDQ